MKSTETTLKPEETLHQRILSVDVLRGMVMVLMALDHTRDFFSNAFFNPLDLSQTTPALFFTRWITHFCAPVFVLLAGAGAYLYGARGRSNHEIAQFLFVRGLLLIALEFTLVHFGWFFNFDFHFLLAQVMWMIGWSMILLAALIFLRVPLWLLTLLGVIMILGHNLLDGISADQFGSLHWLWIILHQPETIGFGERVFGEGRQLYALYSLIPWVGVIMVGYSLGSILLKASNERRKWLITLGIGLTVAFVILRWINMYGDPQSWIPYENTTLQFLSFINVTKYPPSLLFLLMTLGPALMILGVIDRLRIDNPPARVFLVFGRVPLFYYVLHLILIHSIAIAFSDLQYGDAPWLFGTGWMYRFDLPRGYGYDLPVVYLIWVGVLVILYPISNWFSRVKEKGGAGWLKYI